MCRLLAIPGKCHKACGESKGNRAAGRAGVRGMEQFTIAGSRALSVRVRTHRRARRITLRLSPTDGAVTLTVPPGVPEAAAFDFLRARRDWVERHMSAAPDIVAVVPGASLPVEGQPVCITRGGKRGVHLRGGTLCVAGPQDGVGRAVAGWLRARARDALADASDLYARRLGQRYTQITLRDPRSRWGSCSAQGRLMYSWRLIMAPPSVLHYVAAHEVAHLLHMHHQPAFWAAVEAIHGDVAAPRAWLRREGSGLHRYDFVAGAGDA